jgi:hypothetical protein
MGSLALAGAIGGAGEGMQRHAAGERETRLQDDEQAHQLQLQLQRDKAAETRATSREEFDVGMATTRSEYETGQSEIASREAIEAAKLRYTQDESLQTAELASLEHRNWLDNETEIDKALIVAGAKGGGFGAGAGQYSAHGWDVTFGDPTMGPDGVLQPGPVWAYRGNDPNVWMMDGNMMIRAGTKPEDIKPIKDPDKRRFVEDTFIKDGMGDTNQEDDFIFTYGYLPVRYMTEMTLDANEDLATWVMDRRGSYPYYSEAVQKRLGVKSDPWARPGAGGGAGISYTRPGSRGDRAERKVTVPGEKLEEIEVPDIARRPVSPPEMRMTQEAGPIYRGAQATAELGAAGLDLATEGAKAVGGAITRGSRAVSGLFAPAQYEEVPPELQ